MFSKWLEKKIKKDSIAIYDLASDLHMAPRTVYRHLNGERLPNFSHVVAYCWYFNRYFGYEDDPIDVWGEHVVGT